MFRNHQRPERNQTGLHVEKLCGYIDFAGGVMEKIEIDKGFQLAKTWANHYINGPISLKNSPEIWIMDSYSAGRNSQSDRIKELEAKFKPEPVSEKEWMDAYKSENNKLLYVNYQYHKDVCKVSLDRYDRIKELEGWMGEAYHHYLCPASPASLEMGACTCGLDKLMKGNK